MRIRSTKPEFWRSKTIAVLTWEERLVLKGLESYVDDNGVGKDDLALIAADVFPRDLSGNPPETLRRLREAITRIAEVGLIVRYAVQGEDLIYIDRWKQIQYVQKPNRGRFPRPDGTMEYSQEVDPESYQKPPEDVRTGSGEQRIRGSGEQGISRNSQGNHQSASDPFSLGTAERGADLSHPVAVGASRLVASVVRAGAVPDADRTILRIKASELIASGETEDDVAECLREWLKQSNLGPHALPCCMSAVYKRRLNRDDLKGADKKCAEWDEALIRFRNQAREIER